ncbi:hypothetical protein [Caballeronia sp. ATUFL_F2_KS42]|uniref:hypothetical protein n=1 Tax=Caballeronia sp. ATUFL_F2_KS42 TaxID=2921765 RepID=UPI002027ED89|nr:hypothetical protein [Caballeronia sp. ATUFL_F2_KS42]
MPFPGWGYSCNALYVPLTGGWHCALMPAREVQEVDRTWRLPFDVRKQKRKEQQEQIEQDRKDFDRLFRVRIDRRDALSRHDFREYVDFIIRTLRVSTWDRPVDGAGITRVLRRAARERQLIPVIARNWHGGQRVFRYYAPQSWSAAGSGAHATREVLGWREFAALKRANGEWPSLKAVANRASLSAVRDVASSASDDDSGLNWMSVIEAADGAIAGIARDASRADSGSDSMLERLDDSNAGRSLLGDAPPFDYQPDAMNGESFEVAARGVKMSGNEPGGFRLNPNGLDTDFFDANGNLSAQYHESHGDAHGHNFHDGSRDPAHLPMSPIPRR